MYYDDNCEYYKTLFVKAVRALTLNNTFDITHRVIKYMAEFVSSKGTGLVKIVGKNCGTKTSFQYEKTYKIISTNGYASITVAETSYGAIVSFVCILVLFVALLVLLIIWGVRKSKKA